MESYNKNTGSPDSGRINTPVDRHRNRRVLGGLFIVLIGVILLARQAGAEIPGWVLSFETVLIAVGIYIGIRHSFQGFVWLIPTLAGAFLLLDDFYPQYDIEDFTWPVLIITIGLFMMLRPGKKKADWKNWEKDAVDIDTETEDVLDSTVVFGGVKKNIISKNFRGGECVTVFGGTILNLMQADLNGPVVLELTQVFGGTKLIIPPHWKIQSRDMVAIFGGIDDKRPLLGNPQDDESEKLLILKGTCLLGGIEIKSF